jgi:hypothetical protein
MSVGHLIWDLVANAAGLALSLYVFFAWRTHRRALLKLAMRVTVMRGHLTRIVDHGYLGYETGDTCSSLAKAALDDDMREAVK